MATYEYACVKCDKKIEKTNVPMKDFDKTAKCPDCSSKAVRVPSLPGLIII